MTPCLETSRSFAAQFRESFRQLSPSNQARVIAECDRAELDLVGTSWGIYAHDHQQEPDADWRTWLILGGRGAGKTRAGAEWVRAVAAADPAARIALVGETEHDVREVMIEGVSGVLAVHPQDERPQWSSSRRRLEWNNGAVAEAFSAEQPDSLRGPQFSHAWCDELAKWRQAEAAFDNLQFALRLGTRPRQLVTTTPRPISLLKRLIGDPSTVLAHAATQVNAHNLSAAFIDHVQSRYGGTRMGRQEIDGELTMFECPGFGVVLFHALWTGEPQIINGFANLSGLIMAYMAARFGVLGVYVSGRSKEKRVAATGQPVPSLIGQITKAIASIK